MVIKRDGSDDFQISVADYVKGLGTTCRNINMVRACPVYWIWLRASCWYYLPDSHVPWIKGYYSIVLFVR